MTASLVRKILPLVAAAGCGSAPAMAQQTSALPAAARPAAATILAAPTSAPNEAAGAARAAVPLHPDAPDGVAWFDGGVEAAFARAAAEDKPVFLYWGAVWCPYCHDLKAYVFSRPDFREKLKLFVPVYLDGDDPGAQKWGDVFGIAGYPTVLALGPDRGELARIAGGMDLDVYAQMLDLVLGDLRPIGAILSSVDAPGARLSRDDCRRLAYNGWGLDDTPARGDAALAAALSRAAARCPDTSRVERARLTAIAASYAVAARMHAEHGAAVPADDSKLLMTLIARVCDIVADHPLAASISDALQYLGTDFFKLADRQAPAKSKTLLMDWSAAMDATVANRSYAAGDRLMALYSKLEAIKALSGDDAIPAPLAEEAERRVDEALAHAQHSPSLPGVVNGALNVLVQLDDPKRAYAVADEAMQGSATPYYYMSDLADLDERLGRKDEAVAWLERAYHDSKGPATRFQWGTDYVMGLIRMKPDDEGAIRGAAIEVLGELTGPDRIHTRTRAALERLGARLEAWNDGGRHDAAVAAIRARMDRVCAGIPSADRKALASCRAFLAGSSTA